MIKISTKEIHQATGGELLSNSPEDVVSGFSIDSRTIDSGQIFIAIKGENFDGHDFIQDAIEKGASGVIAERTLDPALEEKADHVIILRDTQAAMGAIAAHMRKKKDIPAICITGTNGKTTVKDILSSILSVRYKVLKSKKSYNNIIGLSLTLFDLDSSHEVMVLEIGTNHPGEISHLAKIAAPQVAIITNIGDGHLEGFLSREGVFDEKISLLDSLPKSGTAFLNGDDSLLLSASNGKCEKKFYGKSDGCDFLITDILKKENGCSFSLNGNNFSLPLEGMHNIYNASVAIAAAERMGMSRDEIQKGLENVTSCEMRLEKINMGNLTFINDAYNANPESFNAAFDVLTESSLPGKKGVVAGEMSELGAKSDELHRDLGKNIAGRGFSFLVTLGEKARAIADGALRAGMKKENVLCAASYEEAAELVRQMAGSEKTAVLLKGSRAAKMEGVLKCFTISYTP